MKIELLFPGNCYLPPSIKENQIPIKLVTANPANFLKRANSAIFNNFTLDTNKNSHYERFLELNRINKSYFRRMNYEFNHIQMPV